MTDINELLDLVEAELRIGGYAHQNAFDALSTLRSEVERLQAEAKDCVLTFGQGHLHARIKELEADLYAHRALAARYEKALREMLTPPLVLAEDDATQVADWFVSRARQALTPENSERK